MNFFFGLKSKDITSELTIPRFRNRSFTNPNYYLYEAKIKNEKWDIQLLKRNELNKDFFLIKHNSLNNNKIYFLAKDKELKILEKNNFLKLENLNNFTKTSPAYRSNLKISLKNGGFSSYQSEYPFEMITKKGSILSSINSLANKDASTNIIFIKNIYEKPIYEQFKGFLINIKSKKILKEFKLLTNFTNEIILENKFIGPDIFLFTDKFIGIPMYVSIKNKHISFEHTHPPHEYILSKDKFKKISELKNEINEIVN